MTTASSPDRSHETIINDALARILRDRLMANAVAETLHGRVRPDIVIRRPEGPVILEIELEPALTVEADALSRLGIRIDGEMVQNVFAVTVPAFLRSVNQQRLYERMSQSTLVWQEWRIDGTSGPKQSGLPSELGGAALATFPTGGNLDEAVDVLDAGVRSAGALLYHSPGTVSRVARIFGTTAGNESANMGALVIVNAMTFQERLASLEPAFSPVNQARVNGTFSRLQLLQAWEYILSIDYYPIFNMAWQVVNELSDVEAAQVLNRCAETAAALLAMGAVGRHDLAGRIFNRLISERKLLAAFYTSIPAATLLAGLALQRNRWPDVAWGDGAAVANLRVLDPACGTGTLLMAAYRQILQNHTLESGGSESGDFILHQELVEKRHRRYGTWCRPPST